MTQRGHYERDGEGGRALALARRLGLVAHDLRLHGDEWALARQFAGRIDAIANAVSPGWYYPDSGEAEECRGCGGTGTFPTPGPGGWLNGPCLVCSDPTGDDS